MGFSILLINFLFVISLSLCHHIIAEFNPSDHLIHQERIALYALKASLNDSFLNNSWTGHQCPVKLPSPWYGIQCVNGHVSEIRLEGLGLKGTVKSDAFFFLTKLTVLSFRNNLISGNVMNFSQNKEMKQIDFSGNKFFGSISQSLLSLNLLESLQLQDNNLTGPIPEFNQTSLRIFNLSNNNLHGPIPTTHTLQSFGFASYSNNPELCGPPTSIVCNFSINDTAADTNKTTCESTKKSSKPHFATIFILFDVVGLVAVILLFILYFKKARKLKKMLKKHVDKENDKGDDDDDENDKDLGEEEISEKIIEAGGKDVVVGEEKGKLIFLEDEASFELNDLLKASAEGLGKGNFTNTYKAMMPGSQAVVVKRIRDLKPLTMEEFTKQLHIIADKKHPNLLPLLAYYNSKDEKLLVYKFAENGNLFNRIHGVREKDRIPFRWSARVSVAQGVARALEYLHLNKLQSIVPHGNLKSTNVLLDENGMALVSDYGLTSLIAQPIAVQRMVSHKSPDYQTTKRVSEKSDVWSYGCLLLELLTGRISVHSAPPGINGVDLCSWAHRAVREEWTAEIFDTEVSVQRSAYTGMLRLLQIAMRCCDKSQDKRPEMTEVVREVENIKAVEFSEDEDDLSVDQSLTDESLSTSTSAILGGDTIGF